MRTVKEKKDMKWLKAVMVIVLLITHHALPITAQTQRLFQRRGCMTTASTEEGQANSRQRITMNPKTAWDATRTYAVPVILMEFSDSTFAVDEPHDFYNRLFNEKGYNMGAGPGCVADYFREQSAGLFNAVFDIYGPVKVSYAVRGNDHGAKPIREAVQKVVADNPDTDFSKYDWDGDKAVDGVIVVYACYGGNETNKKAENCIWPNTYNITSVTASSGTKFSIYSASPERWARSNKSCGIGTICHEFCHVLGLPDIYPTAEDATEYSVTDEWDLMDGGNFTNDGWCPPSLSVHEKMLLGWLTPEELTESTTISGLKPVDEGGKAYIVRTTNSNEFFLLENRQWSGWNTRAPGHGLLISHVDYRMSTWNNNTVNNDPNHHRYDLVHADNLSYDDWIDYLGEDTNPYLGGHNRYLSGSPYPYQDDNISNNALTDTSVPAAVTFTGTKLLSKPITDIKEDAEGNISFNFMGGDLSAITDVDRDNDGQQKMYDLTGRRITGKPAPGIVIIDGRKKVVR